MSAVRQLKRTFFQRQWFSPTYNVDGAVTPMKRFGLSHGDVRAFGVRRADQGQRALLDVPTDTLHLDRKAEKLDNQRLERNANRGARRYRDRLNDIKRRSFREIKRQYYEALVRRAKVVKKHDGRWLDLNFFPNLKKAALEIAYDNGMIDRDHTEEAYLNDAGNHAGIYDLVTIDTCEEFLAGLDPEQLQAFCVGEQPPLIRDDQITTNKVLNRLFEEA